jgi:hypothetical protein
MSVDGWDFSVSERLEQAKWRALHRRPERVPVLWHDALLEQSARIAAAFTALGVSMAETAANLSQSFRSLGDAFGAIAPLLRHPAPMRPPVWSQAWWAQWRTR